MAPVLEEIPSIPEFFRNRNIFVTGGSGFIGKVLIEKLLRSCPDIGNIYILLREKKGHTLTERVKGITNTPLFDLLKKQNADSINKIIPINGDICKLGLGINANDRNAIINEVSVVFHIGASVRFDDPLKKAILYNVRGTVEVIKLTKDLKNPAVFAHVSTAYSNCEKTLIEEKLYPAHADWRDAIRLAEDIDPHVLEIFTQKYIRPHVNTYTFTKSLAEDAVNDLCRGEIPTIIYRPTIVTPSLKDPMPGWIENFNGPIGLSVAAGLGIARIGYIDKEQYADFVFVDNVAKLLIAATWRMAVNRHHDDKLTIYNCSADLEITWYNYITLASNIVKEIPYEVKIWAPTSNESLTTWYYYYFLTVLLFHTIPAVFLDGLMKLLGKNPLMIKIQRKIYIANISTYYFTSRTWHFRRDNYIGLEDKLLDCDLEAFSRVSQDFNKYETLSKLMKESILGTKVYLLKESRVISKKTMLIDKSLRYLDRTVKVMVCGYVVYTLFWKYDIVTYLLESVYNYFARL